MPDSKLKTCSALTWISEVVYVTGTLQSACKHAKWIAFLFC